MQSKMDLHIVMDKIWNTLPFVPFYKLNAYNIIKSKMFKKCFVFEIKQNKIKYKIKLLFCKLSK